MTLISMVPMGQTLFGSLNPVRTGGPMQVSIAFAEQHTKGYPWKMDGTVRQEVFSRRGGLWFGTYHLLNYPASYSAPIFRFADFNAGWYASRNAAFQNAVSKASGVKLALDGDLIRYDSKEPGKTELATRKLAGKLGMSDSEIRRQLEKGDSFSFEETALYKKVYQLAEAKTGKSLPREMLPGIQLESPKITRNLTTAWFAKRVDEGADLLTLHEELNLRDDVLYFVELRIVKVKFLVQCQEISAFINALRKPGRSQVAGDFRAFQLNARQHFAG